MAINHDHKAVIVAGGSGLVGSELVKQLLDSPSIEHVYALVRKPLVFQSHKLECLVTPDLLIHTWDEDKVAPTLGFICLGTTLKQAGSKSGLEKVDYELVCQVAQEMKVLGVKKIAVVSSLGASIRSFSHYLRCKGKMEQAIRQVGFEHITFVRPGPLVGLRDTPRRGEIITNGLLKVLRPLLIGRLKNFIPIRASSVAQAMIYSLFQSTDKKVEIYHSAEIKQWLKQYK